MAQKRGPAGKREGSSDVLFFESSAAERGSGRQWPVGGNLLGIPAGTITVIRNKGRMGVS